MIVVVGNPIAAVGPDGRRPAGTAALAAIAAARAGAEVQLIGRIGDDPVGDEVLLALTAERVGHAALLRDPARQTPVLLEGVASEDLDAGVETTVPSVEPPHRAARPGLEPADVELGLRYLSGFRGIVLAEPLPEGVVRAAAEAAGYDEAELVVVTDAPAELSVPLPRGALVLATTGDDAEGTFAMLLGQVAAAVDAGESPDRAFEQVAGRLGASRPG